MVIMIFLFILGLITGSFLNVLIYRLPRGESIVFPPSHCPHCQHRLLIPDLFPVISCLWLKGRCRYCKQLINWRYPLVELLTGLLTLLWGLRFCLTVNGIASLILTYVVVVIAFIDLEHRLILNVLTLPMLILGLAVRWWQGELIQGLWGIIIGGGLLFTIAWFYPKGMGMGDVKYLAMIGAFLGWEKALFILFTGSFAGVLSTVPLMLLKRIDRKTAFPFGPFLALSTLIAIYWEDIVFLIYGYYGL